METVRHGFFDFTMQGLGIFTAIIGIGIKVILILRKVDKGFSVWQWQHGVMWIHHVKHNDVPPYPFLSFDEGSNDPRDQENPERRGWRFRSGKPPER